MTTKSNNSIIPKLFSPQQIETQFQAIAKNGGGVGMSKKKDFEIHVKIRGIDLSTKAEDYLTQTVRKTLLPQISECCREKDFLVRTARKGGTNVTAIIIEGIAGDRM